MQLLDNFELDKLRGRIPLCLIEFISNDDLQNIVAGTHTSSNRQRGRKLNGARPKPGRVDRLRTRLEYWLAVAEDTRQKI